MSPESRQDQPSDPKHLGEMALNFLIDPETRQALHDRLDTVIDQANIDPSRVKGFRLSSWDGMIKNSDSEIEVQKLYGIQITTEIEGHEPKWESIRRVETTPIPFNQEREYKLGEVRQEIILPDLQIGYRKFEDGTTEPFHDTRAIDIALQLIQEVQPSRIILLGDVLDLPQFGKYEQTPEFSHTANMSIEYAHNLLRTIREITPESQIVFLEGNHSRRIEKSIKANFVAAYGLRRAGQELPVLSIPYLLALDQLGVEYVGAYPAGRYFITPSLQCIHGTAVSKNNTAKQVVDSEGVSTIQGHAHRWQSHAKTVRTYEGARQTFAFSLGTLSRIDGHVPSVHSSTDESGRPVTTYEDWQQMIGVVTHDGKSFSLNPVFIDTINNHRTFYGNKIFEPIEGDQGE